MAKAKTVNKNKFLLICEDSSGLDTSIHATKKEAEERIASHISAGEYAEEEFTLYEITNRYKVQRQPFILVKE